MEKTLRWLNLLLIFITFISYLSPFVDPASFWFFSFFGMAYPWLLAVNIIFILFWLSSKNWYFFFSLGCILVGLNHFQSFVGLNNQLPKQKGEISVMTMNSMGYQKIKGDTKTKFQELLATHHPEVIAIQEGFMSSHPNVLKNYPYVHRPNGSLLCIYSKYAFINKGDLNISENRSNGCIFVDLKVDGQILRVYNMHLQSNKVSADASKLQKEGDIQAKETWLDIKGMLGKISRAASIRSAQASAIIAHFKKSKHPIIICGDMNDTPLSYNYELFSRELNDGFKERSIGLGTTYNGTIPLLRIDYIWTDKQLKVNSHKIVNENFSDHYPVISRINIK